MRLRASPGRVLRGPVTCFKGWSTPAASVPNTPKPPYQPSGIAPAAGASLDVADPAKYPVPPQTAKTIGDTLSAKNDSCAWDAVAWNAANAHGRRPPADKRAIIYNRDARNPNFLPHHH